VLERLRVEPGRAARLAERDTADRLGFDKESATERMRERSARIAELQERLYAESRRALLVVLQGLDTSGKDGTIRRVFTGVNPQGVRVASFKAPSDTELAHDYLWRIHAALPPRGTIGVFNRSHYEDLVTTTVLGLIPPQQRDLRIRQVRAFERFLVEEGTTIVKVHLHLGRAEQRERLQARLDDPAKRWKFHREDLRNRARWDDYAREFELAITATSTGWAPWFVVPADHKWASGVAVAEIVATTLEAMNPQVPPPEEDLDGIVVE
jgi:PPK2 family polyphosphate:nucleotide phosphotransferase